MYEIFIALKCNNTAVEKDVEEKSKSPSVIGGKIEITNKIKIGSLHPKFSKFS